MANSFQESIDKKFAFHSSAFWPMLGLNTAAAFAAVPGVYTLYSFLFATDTAASNNGAHAVCVQSSGHFSPGWVKAFLVASVVLLAANGGMVMVAGSDKPGETDAFFGKLALFLGGAGVLAAGVLGLVLFGGVFVPAQETVESFVYREGAGHCFYKIADADTQLWLMRALVVALPVLVVGNIVSTILAVKPPSSGQRAQMVADARARQQARLIGV